MKLRSRFGSVGRIVLLLTIFIGGLFVINATAEHPIISEAWANGPRGSTAPGSGGIEPLEPLDALCPNIYKTASETESAGTEVQAILDAITSATQSCVSSLGQCKSATVPPQTSMCKTKSTGSNTTSITTDPPGIFSSEWDATVGVSCYRECQIA